jgi:hypothetical protein
VSAFEALRSDGILESRLGSGTGFSADVEPVRPDGWVPGSIANPMYQNLLRDTSGVISVACMRTPALGIVEDAIREVVDRDLRALMAEDSYHPRGLPRLRQAARVRQVAGIEGEPGRPLDVRDVDEEIRRWRERRQAAGMKVREPMQARASLHDRPKGERPWWKFW